MSNKMMTWNQGIQINMFLNEHKDELARKYLDECLIAFDKDGNIVGVYKDKTIDEIKKDVDCVEILSPMKKIDVNYLKGGSMATYARHCVDVLSI